MLPLLYSSRENRVECCAIKSVALPHEESELGTAFHGMRVKECSTFSGAEGKKPVRKETSVMTPVGAI
jgi:hypothetical protein